MSLFDGVGEAGEAGEAEVDDVLPPVPGLLGTLDGVVTGAEVHPPVVMTAPKQSAYITARLRLSCSAGSSAPKRRGQFRCAFR